MNQADQKSILEGTVGKRIVYFGQNSNIHGLCHVFKENANFLSRLFWVCVLAASSGCLYLLLEPLTQLGVDVQYTLDTHYLPWTTIFPAVTICETFYPRLTQKLFDQKYPDLASGMDSNLKRYVNDVLYGRGLCSRTVCVDCGPTVACDLHWRGLIDSIHKSCPEMLNECSYNGVEFPCCARFHEVDSEYGTCFSFNTRQSEHASKHPLFSVNQSTGPGVLSFRLLNDAQISLHSPEELATNNMDAEFRVDVKTRIENRVSFLLSIVETETDPVLEGYDINVRGCRYLHEKPSSPFYIYQVYSYGACRLARDTEHAYEHCGCVHPVRDKSYEDKYCNFTGINRLVEHEARQTTYGGAEHLDFNDCLPSCLESELNIIHISKRWDMEEAGKGVAVDVRMRSLPTLRYRRSLVRASLDLVVSIGGIVGLFFGASILSFLEVFYLFSRRNN